MILDLIKIARSLYPFIKEMYLWRDGAEEGKPITRENLVRRKIAVFALIGSLIYNYLVTNMVINQFGDKEELKQKIVQLEKENAKILDEKKICLDAKQISDLLDEKLKDSDKTVPSPKSSDASKSEKVPP
jgi:hypothetical protein